MRYLEDTSRSFTKVNQFLNQTNLSTTNVKGCIEVYDFVMHKDDGFSKKGYNFWQESIQNLVSNPPKDYPRERVEWLQHELG
ncbi:uncharacterized protein LOC110925660 isoform X2 [Helianthus annuus]|nr:uncharacterized protein LOC110925660 isoform X2 [Helianthus annuus]